MLTVRSGTFSRASGKRDSAQSRQTNEKTSAGIEIRHTRNCRWLHGEPCTCARAFRAAAWSSGDRRLVRKTFSTERAAVQWREDACVDPRGVLVAPKPTTLRELGELWWLESARGGGIRNRSGDRHKPSTLRGYEQALRQYVFPALGSAKLQNIRPGDVQRLADTLVGRGLNPSTVRNALPCLERSADARSGRVMDGQSHDRTRGSAVRSVRSRVVAPAEAQTLDSSSTRRGSAHGQRRSTQACAAANCRPFNGQMSTSHAE